MKRAALWASVLLLSACGSANTPTGAVGSPSGTNATPSPSAVASPSMIPKPAAFCSAAHRCLALVTLRGSSEVVVRDITDINHPTTVSHLGAVPYPQFASAGQLSYVDGRKLVRVPLAGSPRTTIATLPSSQWMLMSTWSPDGGTAAYVANSDTRSELHTVTGAANRSVTSMAPFNGGCETRACGDGSSFDLSFSPDGKYISMMQSWGGPNFLLWTMDGKPVATNPASSSYNMSVWSGNSLYFVDASGVVVWRDGQLSTFLPGVRWLRPKASADGGRIVYMTRDAKSLGHIWVVDTDTRKVRELKSSRAEPAFLTPRYVWYKGQSSCSTSAPDCYADFPVANTGTTYIYDLQTGIESQSIITQVYDTWPHAA